MRQRLGIAQALMNRPSVLFLDEPCSALDPAGRAEILDTLGALKGHATTVFMSSHILADVERVCDQVAVVEKGHLLVQSGVKELCERYAQPVVEIQFEESAAVFCHSLRSYPWVEKAVTAGIGTSLVTVKAGEMDKARRELPRLAASSDLTLRHYRMVVPTLEEVFIQLTEGKRVP